MKHLFYSSLFFLLLSVTTVYADNTYNNGVIRTSNVNLENPLNGINTIDDLLVALLNILIVIMIPIIVFFIILAGFKYVTARGNASQITEATRALTYAILGAVLILGAVALSDVIKNTVEQF